MLYNLTMHNQSVLNEVIDREVEEEPRLSPVDNPADGEEVKEVVREAVEDIPKNAEVVIGGLGQFQILISQLSEKMGWNLYFVDMDFSGNAPRPQGIIPALRWSRQEIFDIENK